MTSRALTLAGFVLIVATAVTWGVLAGSRGHASLPSALRRLLATRAGKVLVVAFWAFLGWHLFPRGSGAFE
jgi:hypothetical protein